MGRSELVEGRISHVDVQALRLADEGSPSTGKVDQGLLRDLPHSLVKVLQILRDRSDLLDTAIVSNQLVSDVIIPQAKGN